VRSDRERGDVDHCATGEHLPMQIAAVTPFGAYMLDAA